eukprot:982721-Rhodomonas_salina.1
MLAQYRTCRSSRTIGGRTCRIGSPGSTIGCVSTRRRKGICAISVPRTPIGTYATSVPDVTWVPHRHVHHVSTPHRLGTYATSVPGIA